MFIVFGTKAREKIEETGIFNCPQCCTQHAISHNARQHSYQKIKVAKYFTLYFIPLFPVETLGHYIKCAHCNSEYNETVLDYIPAPSTNTKQENIMDDIERELKSGTPIQMMINKLKDQGYDARDANYNIKRIVRGHVATCQKCNVDFMQGVAKCCLCDEPLPQ